MKALGQLHGPFSRFDRLAVPALAATNQGDAMKNVDIVGLAADIGVEPGVGGQTHEVVVGLRVPMQDRESKSAGVSSAEVLRIKLQGPIELADGEIEPTDSLEKFAQALPQKGFSRVGSWIPTARAIGAVIRTPQDEHRPEAGVALNPP